MAVISSITIDTTSASKSIADLEKEIAQTNEQLKQVDINSSAFKELQKKAADAKGQLDKINQATDTMSKGFQGFGESLAKTTGAISGGITAATAAMQLMGVENENVMEGIAKLQQLMAFTQGISALKDLGEGMRALNIATKGLAGPIGLVMAAISALVLVWNKWGDKLRADFPIVDKVATALENLKNKIVGVDEAVKKATEGEEALADIQKQLDDIDTSKRLKLLNDEAKQTYDLYQNELKRLDLEKQKYSILMQQAASKEEFEKYKAEGLAVLQQQRDIEQQITNLFADRKSYAEDIEKTEFDMGDMGDTEESGSSTTPSAPDIEREEEEDDGWADKVTAAQEYYNSIMEMHMNEYEQFVQLQDQKKQKLQEMYDSGLISAEQFTSASKELSKEETNYKLKAYLEISNGISSALSTLADSMDETNEEQFNTMKAFQITSATINTITGAIGAYMGASSNPGINAIPVVGPGLAIAMGVANAAVVTAAGIANIRKISQQKFNGGTSSSSSATASLSSSAASVTPPEQYSSAVEGASIESAVEDTRVYVVESDINQTGQRVSVQETENRY